MSDDNDVETNRQEYVFQNLKKTMDDTKARRKIFLALCGAPVAANQANMMMGAIDQFLHPKAKS